ncbi:MAG TPA: alpha/beta hydrolase [Candidatus Babeliaceae bacterium]|nr:alpha/beta hydrolase [Candidatus Babeliaceae bacterium]
MARWTTRTCEINGINIHYLRTGGNKPSIVLLHGLMTSGACWTPLARELEENYDVIMPDARGHGNSTAPHQGYCYNNLAIDVLSLIDALGLDDPVLIGHSMGGMTAAVVASRSPKRLRGLVLADPAFLTPQRQIEVYESDVVDQHRQVLNRSREDFLAETRTRRSHRSSELIELFVQARFQTSIHAFEILTPPNPDYMRLIETIDIPSLLVIGGVGGVVSSEVAAELARLNQRLEIVQIAEAGHAIPFDQPKRFSSAVKAFLGSLSVCKLP